MKSKSGVVADESKQDDLLQDKANVSVPHDIPDSWVWAQFGDVASIDSFLVSPKDYPDAPHVAPDNIEKATGKLLPYRSISEDGVTSNKNRFFAGQIIYSKIRPYLSKVIIAEFDGLCSADMYPVSTQVEVEYLFHYMLTEQFLLEVKNLAGNRVVLPKVNQKQLNAVRTPIAPIQEQTRIVTAIESLQQRSSRARTLLTEVRPKIETLRQSILQAAFSGRLTADWRAKNPDVESASQLLDRIRTERRQRWETAELAKYEAKGKKPPKNWKGKYKEPEPVEAEELNLLEDSALPAGWEWAPAELIVEPEAEIVYGIVQPGKKLNKGVPYVRGKDIIDGEIQIDQLLNTSEEIAAKYERASLRGGDVLLGIIRATKVAVVPAVLEGANITQGTARFRPSSIIRTSFLAQWLESPAAQGWLHDHYRGIDMPGLNLRDVRRLPIPIASQAEQEKLESLINKAVANIASMIDGVEVSNSSLDKLDQSILSKAFRGELVPQDPNDEPAADLLARIRASREADKPKPKRRKSASK